MKAFLARKFKWKLFVRWMKWLWIFHGYFNESNLFFRKSRSPGKRASRSPSRSPGRRGSPFGSDENDRVNNNDFLQQKSVVREREEEKRRLQAEMRRREQELLAKIKEQQRELENMKQEKGKVKSLGRKMRQDFVLEKSFVCTTVWNLDCGHFYNRICLLNYAKFGDFWQN